MASTSENRELGKRFIANLKATIDAVEVYAPTGKYGKKELDKRATREEKMEKLLLASPDTPYEVLEYVFFCKSLGAIKSKSTLRHLSAVMERAKMEYHNDPIVKQASSIVNGMKRKRTLDLSWRILCLIIGIAVYVWGFTTEWKLGWKIAWGVVFGGAPLGLGMFPLLLISDRTDNLFDN